MWTTISKNKTSDAFYPVHTISTKLNSLSLTYEEARKKPVSFWKDKSVLFHLVWANNLPNVWRPLYKSIANNAKNFIFEFDADKHMNNLETIDSASWGSPLLFYNEVVKVSNNFIWELPMNYNPFIVDTNRIELNLWDNSLIEKRKDKDTDFLGFVDTNNSNIGVTMRLLDVLHRNNYNVKCIVLSPKYIKLYSNLGFEIVRNTKFTKDGQTRFFEYLDRSKFYIDLTTRLTAGRNLYEALFRHCIPIASTTYGASKLGYRVETLQLDLKHIYNSCINLEKDYETLVSVYQVTANNHYNIERTVDDLRNFATT